MKSGAKTLVNVAGLRLRSHTKINFNDRIVSYAYSQLLAVNGGLLLHAAAVTKGKRTFLFFAASDGGKSTVAAISKSHEVLSDDVVAVRKVKGAFYAFPTPWRQSGFVGKDLTAKGKIRAIFFIKKSKRIHFTPLSGARALANILSGQIHFFSYTSQPLIKEIFFTAAGLVKRVKAYEMEFTKAGDFWPKLEDCLSGRR